MAKENIPMHRQMERDARIQHVPFSGKLELTPRCTLDCKMCYVHLTEQQMGERKELSTEQWIEYINEAWKLGMTYVLLTGGECLLHKGFRQIYKHLKKLGTIIVVNTNATLLNDEYISFFKEDPPCKLQVSLYGMSEDGYERVTGRRVFNRVKENILKIRDAGIKVKISVTNSKYLNDEALEIVQFARDNGIDYIYSEALREANEDTGRQIDDYGLTAAEAISMNKKLYAIEERQLTKNETIAVMPPKDQSGTVLRGLKCAAGHSSFTIKWDGTLLPCLWTPEEGIDLKETGFREAWEKLDSIANQYIIPIECETCQYRKVCHSCAALRRDPKNPAHCNRMMCQKTISAYNAGLLKMK